MERGKEIRPENDDPMMSNSAQLIKHPSEVMLTIPTSTDDEQETLTSESNNPRDPPSIPSSSKPNSNNPESLIILEPKFGLRKKTPKSNSYVDYDSDWSAISHFENSGADDSNADSYFDNSDGGDSGASPHSDSSATRNYPRPEKNLIKFALWIVIMEKAANGIGLLAFIWATVALLGGFASTLKTMDFGFMTIIIFMAGTGLFNHSNQLDSRFFVQATKVISSTIGRNLPILQFSFANICIALSVMRLVEHHYSEDPNTTNMKMGLYIFYAMALVYGVLCQLKMAYWFWKVSYSKIIQEVGKECGLEMSGDLLVKRFFYETYCKLSKGNVFSALDLDLNIFAQGLLISDSRKDQLIAVRILNGTINHEKYSEETCRRLETSTETIGRLFKMLTWKYQEDGTIRMIAARIVERLASGLLVEDIPGGMDCIQSLIVPKNPKDFNAKTLELNLLGLKILTKLADKPKNCWKINETHGLLLMIVEFTKYKNDCIPRPDDQLKIVKRSLMLLTRIISIDGKTGKMLRRNISKIAFTVSNLRDILINEARNPKLFRLVAESLAALSMDMDARKKIGSTSGIIKVLLSIFFHLSYTPYECELRVKAGGVLAMLVLQSKRNCSEIFYNEENVIEMLTVDLLRKKHVLSDNGEAYWHIDREIQKRRISICRVEVMYKIMAMKILRNLCAYAGRKWQDKLRVVDALPWVLKTIMSTENDYKLLEASIGLCVQICKYTSIEEYDEILRNAGYSMFDVAKMLLKFLKENVAPNNTFPCLRRYAIELAIWMMESYDPFISYFKAGELGNVLTQVAETTSELENFHFFSGDVGVAKHPQTISSLVLKAKRLL